MTGNNMDRFCRRFYLITILLSFSSALLLSACGSSNSPEIDDTRPTIDDFLHAENTDIQFELTEAQKEEVKLTANQASLSFAQYAIDENELNTAIVTWPMLSSLPYLFAASQDNTYTELQSSFEVFGSIKSLIGFSALTNTPDEDTTRLSTSIWWQYDHHYETDFLIAIDHVLRPHHYPYDFSLNNQAPTEFEQSIEDFFEGDYTLNDAFNNDTESIILHQTKTLATFENTLQLESFEGIFENGHEDFVRTPMLRIQGEIARYESNELLAHKLPLTAGKLSITTIIPKAEMYNYVLTNIGTILQDLRGAWTTIQSSVILPEFSFGLELAGNAWLKSIDVEDIYSEYSADLRNMDRLGGHYIRSQAYKSRVSLSAAGLDLAAITSNILSFSKENNVYRPETDLPFIAQPDFDFSEYSSGVILTNYSGYIEAYDLDAYTCIEPVPDVKESLMIITDESTGLIQAVITINTMQGEKAGKQCTLNQPHEVIYVAYPEQPEPIIIPLPDTPISIPNYTWPNVVSSGNLVISAH